MKGVELIIKFIKDKAYLTPDKSIHISKLLNTTSKHNNTFNAPAYWKVQVLEHFALENRLFCKILSYNVGDISFSFEQRLLESKLSKIQTINFKSIDTVGLLKSMQGSTKLNITPKTDTISEIPNFNYQHDQIERKSFRESITRSFKISLKKVTFIDGGIVLKRQFKEFQQTLEITIKNEQIKKEYDSVKDYFANILNSRMIEIILNIDLIDNELSEFKAISPEIDKIDNSFIKLVEHEKSKAIKTEYNKSEEENKNSILTKEEFLKAIIDEIQGLENSYENDEELIKALIAIIDTKHYKQLRYLSKMHSYKIMRLRYVKKPISFIFMIEIKAQCYFIWETLNTEEATYVWSSPNEKNKLKAKLKELEIIISNIQVNGKLSYINAKKDQFNRVFHDYSENNRGFEVWKKELEAIME